MNVPLWIAVPTLALAALAVRADVRTRRIPNALTGIALLLALAAHSLSGSGLALRDSLLGAVVAGGLLLPGWTAGWMGAGDVKLMAAIGAWVGYPLALVVVLAALMAGGVLALAVAVHRRMLWRSLHATVSLLGWTAVGAGRGVPAPAPSGTRFPFAFAALAGALVAMVIPFGLPS
jgi:prepilin peptidase CpaA